MKFETENIEFKSQVTDDLYKDVIAFANTDGDIFEEMRSMEQELTFNNAIKTFERYKVEFSREKYRILGITDNSELLYTNLALMLSDQCQHTTKVVVFADESNTEFRDSKEFTGSIFKQLDEIFDYLKLCNKTQATFKGLERIENPDYPEEAIREALLNAIVHTLWKAFHNIGITASAEVLS